MTVANIQSPAHKVLPISVYLFVGGFLLILTLITVLVSQHSFGAGNVVIALFIAAVKGSLVALYFMHLRYDNRFFAVIFVIAFILLGMFISLILLDTLRRGDIDQITAGTINPHAIIYDNNGSPLPMDARQFGIKAGTVAGVEPVDDVPFEIRHGYGPIKEEVKVGPLDTVLALRGKPMFESKCATCHKLDERYTGPPLRGVTAYRSPTFIMNQILDPAQNVAKHPDMKAMLMTYYTYMTNQNVTVEDARALVEYLRWESQRGEQSNNQGKARL